MCYSESRFYVAWLSSQYIISEAKNRLYKAIGRHAREVESNNFRDRRILGLNLYKSVLVTM